MSGAIKIPPAPTGTLSNEAGAAASPIGELPTGDPAFAVGGRYRIDGVLGQGGMGHVFAAHDEKLGRPVAIKFLNPGMHDAEQFARFEQEARAAGGINHPNIVTVYDVVATTVGPCIISERLEGETLRELLRRGPLVPDRAAELTRQLAEGLSAAHDKRVVHRDLKPANLFLTRDGRLKILDFGIAKLLEPVGESLHTQSGAVMGTVGYMAPEQIRGEAADVRSDLFAAGVILHQMLAGSPPFEAPSQHAIEERILHAAPHALPVGVPVELERIARRCLEKEPARRFQSASELHEQLSAFQSGLPAPAPALDERLAARRGRHAARYAAIGLLAAASVSGGWYLLARGRRAPPVARPEPSIAVLPFADLSPHGDQAYFSDGVAAEIVSALVQIEGLRVAGRVSSFSLRKVEDLRQVGEKLKVAHVLEGSVQREGNKIRITASMIGVADGHHVWSKTFNREIGSILVLQDDIAREVATALRVKLLPTNGPGTADKRSIDPEAYNLYLLANRFHYTFKQEDVQRSVPLYEKAVALEPGLAPAWAMLGMAYWWLGGPPASAIAAVEKAVGVDPGSGTAYAARGVVRGWTWDVSGSNADHERSLALSPKDPWVIGQYCVHELRMGRYASAVATCRQASDLDPLSAAYWNYITFAHLGAGELSAAKAANARALVLSPDSTVAKYHQCRIAFFSGELSRAVDLCARLPEEIDGLAFTALARSQLGDADEAARALRALVAKAGQTNPGIVARVYAGLGDTDVAFEWLDRAYALESTHMALVFPRHSLSAIKVEPLFRKLHGDARYIALLEKMKLPVD